MPKQKRTKRFELRLSEKEEEVFYRNARLCEMTPTQYIRTLMFMLKPTRIPTEKYVRILDELTDIRKTLNDIVNIGVLNENVPKLLYNEITADSVRLQIASPTPIFVARHACNGNQ